MPSATACTPAPRAARPEPGPTSRVIVVTAVHAPSARYLPEAWKSLREQELPGGWEWHWDPAERAARMAVAEARARAPASFGWSYPAVG